VPVLASIGSTVALGAVLSLAFSAAFMSRRLDSPRAETAQ
jgi:predicted exporter